MSNKDFEIKKISPIYKYTIGRNGKGIVEE